MKIWIISFVGFILPILNTAQQPFTLEEALEYAIEKSNTVKMSDLAIQDAESQLTEYKAIGMPKLDGNVDYQYNFEIVSQPTEDFITPAVIGVLNANDVTPDPIPIPDLQTFNIPFGQKHNFTAGLRAETMVFDGSFFVGLRAQRLFRELVTKQKEQAEYEVRAAVTKAYVNVLINKQNATILQKNIANLETTLAETNEIYKSGFIEKLDVDRLQLSLDNLKADLKSVEYLDALSKNLLKFQMSYPISEDIVLTDDIESLLSNNALVFDQIPDINYEDRPEFRVLLQNEKLNEINIERFKKGYYPTVRAFATFNRSLQDNDFVFGTNNWIPSSAAGLSISVPIFDGLDKKAKIERAKISLEENQLQKEEFMRAMDLEVHNAWVAYQNALVTKDNREKNMELAQEIYDVAQIKYREGVGSSVEVTQAEREFFSAERNFINALYDVLVTKTDLETALGKL